MAIPRPNIAVPQSAAPQHLPKPSLGGPAQHQRNCPKCGASIDYELGRCTGCGLLFGGKHRVMQQAAPMPAAPMPRVQASRPPTPIGQQTPAAYPAVPRVSNLGYSVPPPSGQHPNYMPSAVTPPPGTLMPIPRIAPAVPGTMPPVGIKAGALVPTRPYQYEAPPPPTKPRATAPSKGGLSGFAISMITVIILLIAGGAGYYFLNRSEAEPPVVSDINNPAVANSSANNSTIKLIDVNVQATTETSATIRWITDKPAIGRVEVRDANDTLITETKAENLADKQSVTVSGLQSGTKYFYTVVVSKDAEGNEATSQGDFTTRAVADKTAPTISAIAVSNITESSAIITWLTDEPATGQVRYLGSDNTSSTTTEQTDLDTSHSVALSKLDSGTAYSFTIISKDTSGNQASLSGQPFTTLTPVAVGIDVGKRAPDFTAKNLAGKNAKLGDFSGKIVVLNFWAVWCEPCQRELPYMQGVSDNWSSDELVVLAIAANDNETIDTVTQFISEKGYDFPVLYDSGQATNLYNIGTWPTTFFIDKKGIIKKIQVGSFQDQETIEGILSSLQ